jgi:hypothetical protein
MLWPTEQQTMSTIDDALGNKAKKAWSCSFDVPAERSQPTAYVIKRNRLKFFPFFTQKTLNVEAVFGRF